MLRYHFNQSGPLYSDTTGLPAYNDKSTVGTRIGQALLDMFRYRRTGFIGAPLPGKLMLQPPPLRRYNNRSCL